MPSNAQSVHQSMVSLEEPRSLVQQLVTKFYPENDVSTITNIDRSHSKVQQARLKELSESHEQLQIWIKRVEAAKWEAQRPAEKSELKHEERMSDLEREKFQLVKEYNDQELAIQQLETSISSMKNQLSKLKGQNVRLEQPEIDVFTLQLQLLQNLKANWDNGADGVQCVVKSRAQNDIHVFRLNDFKDAKMELTKKIWDAIGVAP